MKRLRSWWIVRRCIRMGVKDTLKDRYGRFNLQDKLAAHDRNRMRIQRCIWFKTVACWKINLKNAQGFILPTLRATLWRLKLRILTKDFID